MITTCAPVGPGACCLHLLIAVLCRVLFVLGWLQVVETGLSMLKSLARGQW